MAGKICNFLHPNAAKREKEHEAERQVAILRQQVAAIEQEAANKKNSELAQLASAQLAAQQELSNDYQSCIEQTHAALSDAHETHHTKLIEASSWLIWGRAIITAEHTAQMTKLLQARDSQLQSIPQRRFNNLGSVDISLDPRQKSLIFEHSSAVYTLVNEQRSAENQRFMPGIVEMSTDPIFWATATGYSTARANSFKSRARN